MNTTITRRLLSCIFAITAIAILPMTASAQGNDDTLGNGTPSEELPPPQSDNDPQPQVAAPEVPDNGVTEQAGVGGTQAYGRAGVLELGGSMSLTAGNDLMIANASPSLGWFFMDNVQISAIAGFNYAKTNDSSEGASFTTLLAEPSVHLPFNNYVFGFGGLGVGGTFAEGAGAGFAMAPRLGFNILVGRSGVLTPAFNFNYSTVEAIETPNGSLLAVNSTYGANIGYTVMW